MNLEENINSAELQKQTGNENVEKILNDWDVKESIKLDKNEKKQLKTNIIKFAIWIVLLLMSWSYLQKHPAEKVSVFSWFEVLFQKAEVFIQNLFGEDGDLLERKYSMEKYYKELIKMAENNKCVSLDEIKEIQNMYNKLKKESKHDLDSILPSYTKKAYEYDNLVKNNDC